MILPVRITPGWLDSSVVSKACFIEAKNYFDIEAYDEAEIILEKLLTETSQNEDIDGASNLQILVMYGWILLRKKDDPGIRDFVTKISELKISDYPDLEVLRLWVLYYAGKNQELYEASDQNLDSHNSQIDIYFGQFLLMKGISSGRLGNLKEAIELSEASYSIFLLCDNSESAGYASNFLGIFYRHISDYRESLKWYERSLECFGGKNWSRRESAVFLNIGVTQYKLGRFHSSRKSLEKSLKIGVETKRIHRQVFPNIALGNVHRLQRDLPTAQKYLLTALAQSQEVHYPREEALSLEFLGDIHRDEHQYTTARQYYQRVMTIAKTIAPKGDLVMEAHRRIGECHNLEGNYSLAMPELLTAQKMAQAQGDRYEEGVTLRIMAETCRNTFDTTNAALHIENSITLLRSIEANYELAVALLTGAEITYAQLENPASLIPKKLVAQKAWDQSTKALDLFIQVDVSWWIEKTRVIVGQIVNTRAALDRAERTGRRTGSSKSQPSYHPGDAIIHSSSLMKDLLELCDMFAVSDEPILILGETGTGKELVAKRIHRTSKRNQGELVTVNVAAIPEQMFEREFFGHIRGSFSGADRDGKGFAALANGGTLFLDEIGDLPMDAQAKLLRLLQDGTYQALGDPKQRHTDLRVVAATNANLPQLVSEGKFRSDLYYRLRTLELPIPALRDRPEDVLPLLRHFLSVAAKTPRELTEYFNRSSLDLLEQHNWPGNVREVSMLARRAHVELISRGQVKIEIQRRDKVPLQMTGPGYLAMEANAYAKRGGSASVESMATPTDPQVERARIIMALDQADGNRKIAAQVLGVSRSTLYRKIEKFEIDI